MRSIAIWSNLEQCTAKQLHINFWELPCFWRGSHLTRFIDLGLRLPNPNGPCTLFFLLPFNIHENDIIPLNSECCDTKVACAIFNENLTISDGSTDIFHEFKLDNRPFLHYLDMTPTMWKLEKIEKLCDVNKLVITLPTQEEYPSNVEEIYIRFRIHLHQSRVFSSLETLPNAPLQNISTAVETLDFRINDVRDIGKDLLTATGASKSFLKFEKIHFFFMCASHRELKLSNTEWVNCRYLEKGVWNTYLKTVKHGAKHILAYHWKSSKSEGVNNFSILLKTLIDRWSLPRLLAVALISLALSVCIGCLSNYMYDYFSSPALVQNSKENHRQLTVNVDTNVVVNHPGGPFVSDINPFTPKKALGGTP